MPSGMRVGSLGDISNREPPADPEPSLKKIAKGIVKAAVKSKVTDPKVSERRTIERYVSPLAGTGDGEESPASGSGVMGRRRVVAQPADERRPRACGWACLSSARPSARSRVIRPIYDGDGRPRSRSSRADERGDAAGNILRRAQIVP